MAVALVGSQGSYICRTECGAFRVEHAWSGGCLPGGAVPMSPAGPSTLRPCHQGTGCGACTDLRIHFDTSLPSLARMPAGRALEMGVANCDRRAWLLYPRPLRQSGPLSGPPHDAAILALQAVVLLV